MELIGGLLTGLRRLLVLMVLLGMLALNVASFTVATVAEFMSDVVRALDLTSILPSPTEAAELRKANRELKKDLKKSEVALSNLKGDVDQSRRAREAAEALAEAAERKADEAVEALAASKTAANNAVRGLAAVRQSADELTKRVGERVVRGAARNIASIPLESVPIVGVLTIASITALETYDACQTLEDMEELRTRSAVEEADKGWASEVCSKVDLSPKVDLSKMSVDQCFAHSETAREALGDEAAASIENYCECIRLPGRICDGGKATETEDTVLPDRS